MKYPRIPHDLQRNVKVTRKVLEKIKRLRKEGFAYRKIARKLSLSYTTIHRYLQSPEKRLEEKQKKRIYDRVYRSEHEPNKENTLASLRSRRRYRKVILKEKETNYISFANTKERYKNASGEELLELMSFHKRQIANLLEIDPLLILFSSKEDKVKIMRLT